MSEIENIHVVFAPDENYVVHAGVAIDSILFHAKEPKKYCFYLLEGEAKFSYPVILKFKEIVRRYSARLDTIRIDFSKLDKVPRINKKHLSKSTYSRFLIPEALQNLKQCIYLDCDLVVLDDLADIWNIKDIKNYAIAAVKDNYVCENVSFKFPEINTYFNAGVLYMNLQKWRERSYDKICIQRSLDPYYVSRYEDQDVLNVVFAQDVMLLDSRWNITSYDWSNLWTRPVMNPAVAHYAGGLKPWNHSYNHYLAQKYWFYFARTPWAKGREDEIRQALNKNIIFNNFEKRFKKSVKDLLRYFFKKQFP